MCVLVGTLLVAVLAISLTGHQQSRSTGRLSRLRDNLLHFLGVGQRRPSFSKCIDNLHRIEVAKNNWAGWEGKTTNGVPTWDDLRDYLAEAWLTNGIPICPSGGKYMLNHVGEPPTCSIGGAGHSLFDPYASPQKREGVTH